MKVTSKRTYLVDIPVEENEGAITTVIFEIPIQEFEADRDGFLRAKVREIHRTTVERLEG